MPNAPLCLSEAALSFLLKITAITPNFSAKLPAAFLSENVSLETLNTVLTNMLKVSGTKSDTICSKPSEFFYLFLSECCVFEKIPPSTWNAHSLRLHKNVNCYSASTSFANFRKKSCLLWMNK